MVVAAVDAAAAALGLHAGMPLAQAQALVPGLERGCTGRTGGGCGGAGPAGRLVPALCRR